MAFQTVTTILSSETYLDAQLQAAIGVARALDSHLHVLVLATGMDPAGVMQTALDAVPMGMGMEESIEKVKALGTRAAEQLRKEDVRWDLDGVALPTTASSDEIVKHTRFSDLVILKRADGPQAQEGLRTLAETVLFEADCPVLILPEGTGMTAPPGKIMVCWDESATALRATRQAMPLLQASSYVHVVLVEPPTDAPDRSDPGGAFAQFLSRQGIKSEVSVCNRTDDSIATSLQRRADELGCDMIVMGAYGHSRLRQAIFGGTTRDILKEARLPVLMAH